MICEALASGAFVKVVQKVVDVSNVNLSSKTVGMDGKDPKTFRASNNQIFQALKRLVLEVVRKESLRLRGVE